MTTTIEELLAGTEDPPPGKKPTSQDKVQSLIDQTSQEDNALQADSIRWINSEYRKMGIPELNIADFLPEGASVPRPTNTPPNPAAPPPAQVRKGDVFVAAARSGVTGVVQGVFSPFGSLIPDT